MVCFYTNILCVITDMFVHKHQLDYAMRKLWVFLAFVLAVWVHVIIR